MGMAEQDLQKKQTRLTARLRQAVGRDVNRSRRARLSILRELEQTNELLRLYRQKG